MTSCVSRQRGGVYEAQDDCGGFAGGIGSNFPFNHLWPLVAGGGGMTKDEALDLALEALESIQRYGLDTLSGRADGPDDRAWQREGVNEMTKRATVGITAIKQARSAPPVCDPHPKAPHGFNRNASHSADRYVCDCEGWDAYEAGYQAGIEDTYKRMDALDKKAENARELGLDYEPVPENFIDALKFDVAMRDAAPVQEPVAWRYTDARGHYRYRGYVPGFDAEYQLLKPEALCLCATTPPAQPAPVQEPVDTLISAWQALEETSGHVLDVGDVEGRMHISVIRSTWEQMDSLVREMWDERGRP
jgi:hypothetical protein